jgi:hypothetical protein
MANRETPDGRLPPYREATFTEWRSVPSEVRAALQAARLPQNFFGRRYTSRPVVEAVEIPGRGTVYRFGTEMLSCSIYWDPATGEVLGRADRPIGPHDLSSPGPLYFVNSGLAQFTETVRAMLAAFPYYDRSDSGVDDPERDPTAVADDLRRTISLIDPPAAEADDGFWDTFFWDVGNGDFATQDVLYLMGE